MRSEQNPMRGETRRWPRIGTLTLTTIIPFLLVIVFLTAKRAALVMDKEDVQEAGSDLDERTKGELEKRRAQQLRKELRQHRRQQASTSFWKRIQDLLATSLGKLQAVGAAFIVRISRPRPSKRPGKFTDALKERASNLPYSIAERGQALAEYRDDLSHELRKRGRRVRRTLQKQNRRLQKRWQKQFQQQHRRTFWIAAVFGFVLTLAGIISYQFLRPRLQRHKEGEEVVALELPYTDIGLQNGDVRNTAPPDAAFVGVPSTKLYYPIETPLDQLLKQDDSPVEAIYFISEQEASKEGFQPAQSY